jgi:putative transposase
VGEGHNVHPYSCWTDVLGRHPGFILAQSRWLSDGLSHMRKELVLDALEMAIAHRRPTGSLIFHSDRGSQYASDKFRERLMFLNITQSMSRKGNCWDNAPAEIFFGKLKTEWTRRRRYRTRDEAKQRVYYYQDVLQ